MNPTRLPVPLAAAAALFGLLSCRPVFAIGMSELVIIGLVFAVLLGPLFLRLLRSLAKYKETQDKNRE